MNSISTNCEATAESVCAYFVSEAIEARDVRRALRYKWITSVALSKQIDENEAMKMLMQKKADGAI